jgi:cerevisin
VSIGNDNKDACKYSPAAAELAVTVCASTIQDERAYFSNHGECVDVCAPGLNILSTWIGSKSATNTISGTSMASPHTAGMLAYLLSIYPSTTFDPAVAQESLDMAAASRRGLAGAYAAAYAVVPSWASTFLPTPALVKAVAASHAQGPATISPPELKKALLTLSTRGALSDLPAGTPNLLIFNNATHAA